MGDVFVCDAVRTPIGRFGGSLAKVRADDLAAAPIKAFFDLQNIPGSTGRASMKCFSAAPTRPARTTATWRAWRCCSRGFRPPFPARPSTASASGLDAVGAAGRAIRAGEIDFAIAGGVESMTRGAFVMGKAPKRIRLANIDDTTIGWRFIIC